MRHYYNENDEYAAQWLRNLIAAGAIPAGEVDTRSIVDVQADDLRGFVQCHFFAGIGGWPLALKLAGWPDDRPVWTGSCPCQPVSSAARGRNVAIDMWPAWRKHIVTIRPRTIFGEQIAQAAKWQNQVGDDLEACNYAFGSVILPALSVGQDHIRYRFYFVGHANSQSKSSKPINGQMARMRGNRSHTQSMVQTYGISTSMALMRAFGNAIVPQVAKTFIEAYLDCSTTVA